jgi:Lrp/AsnC family leucine-responsive transcriptional regulator
VNRLDAVDLRILGLLQTNARRPQVEIARAVGLAPSAVLERIRKLETRGVITGFTTSVDPALVDRAMVAFIAVRTTARPGDDKVGRELAKIPDVLEVHHVAGEDCLLLKVRTRDAQHLAGLLRRRVGRIAGVQSTRTTIVLETVKECARLPLPEPVGAGLPAKERRRA